MEWNEKKNENVQMDKNRGNKTITIKRRRKNSQESNKFGYFESHWICVLFVAKIPYKEADYIIITGFFSPFFLYLFFFLLFLFLNLLLSKLPGNIGWIEAPFKVSQHQTFMRPYQHSVLTATIGLLWH